MKGEFKFATRSSRAPARELQLSSSDWKLPPCVLKFRHLSLRVVIANNGVGELPLTNLALQAFRDQMALAGNGDYFFPSDLITTG